MISTYIINDYRAISKRSRSTVLQIQSVIIDFYRFFLFVIVIPAIICNFVFLITGELRNVITVSIAAIVVGFISLIYTNKPKTITISISDQNTVEVSGYTLSHHKRRLNRSLEGLYKLIIVLLLIYTILIVRYSIMH